MAIFSTLRGKRGGRRESIFGSSGPSDEHGAGGKASSLSDANNSPYSRDATDVLGEAPSFSRNRTPSESASLKNRQSSNMLRLFGSGKRSTSTSGHEPPSTAPGSSSLSDAGHHRTSQNTVRQDPTFASSLSLTQNGSSAVNDAAAGPRPSDLFAGKGVNWDQVKLSGAPIPPADNKRNDELQNFLKARRQWIPTFKTDVSAGDADKGPAKLEEVSFGGAPAAPSGLMTLKDLEASHNRKQKLLSDLPVSSLSSDPIVGGNGATPASPISPVKPSLISRPSQSSSVRAPAEAPARNQSFRQSPFVGSSSTGTASASAAGASGGAALYRNTSIASSNNAAGLTSPVRKPAPSAAAILSSAKENGNGSAHTNGPPAAGTTAATPAPATVSAPPRKSSVALPTDEIAPTAAPTASAAALAVPAATKGEVDSSAASVRTSNAGTSAIRPSLDSTSGFQTPEARSEAAHVEDATPRPN